MGRFRPGPWGGLALVLVLVYGARAATGVVGGVAYAKGSRLADQGDWEPALRYLEWAIHPLEPAALLWLRGQVRLGPWEDSVRANGPTPESDAELARAFGDYSAAFAASPGSGWYWVNVGEIYLSAERQARARRAEDLALAGVGPWALVGRDGRIAIGLARIGVAREPSTYTLRDELALTYLYNRLDGPFLDAVRGAAEVQPMYHLHPFRTLEDPPAGMVDAFAEASRAALGHTPLLRRTTHLIALARVEVLRQNWTQAELDAREALTRPGDERTRAEAQYYLGVALSQQARWDPAVEMLEASRGYPSLEVPALTALAQLAERRGQLEQALDLWRQTRRLEPRRVAHALEFARVARRLERWDQCQDALAWARILRPTASRPLVELVELFLARGDLAAAFGALEDLARQEGADDPEVVRLREALAAQSGRHGPART